MSLRSHINPLLLDALEIAAWVGFSDDVEPVSNTSHSMFTALAPSLVLACGGARLRAAARGGHTARVATLSAGAPVRALEAVSTRARRPRTALQIALWHGNEAASRVLLEAGASPCAGGGGSSGCLALAARWPLLSAKAGEVGGPAAGCVDRETIAEALLHAGAPATDAALLAAVRHARWALALRLLAAGARATACESSDARGAGASVLALACSRNGGGRVAAAIAAAGGSAADASRPPPPPSRAALVAAASAGYVDVALAVLAATSPLIPRATMDAALCGAAFAGSAPLVAALLRAGASSHAATPPPHHAATAAVPWPALLLAASGGHAAAAAELLRAGADARALLPAGDSALTLAIEAGSATLALDLLDAGAPLLACPAGSPVPLMLAESRGLGGVARAIRARLRA